MRVLLVVGAYPPSDKHGGPAITNHYLAKSLQSLGHRVLVLTTDINGRERLDVPAEDTEFEGVPVRYCRWAKCPLPYHSPELGREVRRRASLFDIALISSSWTSYGVSAGRACCSARLPYLMYPHGSYGPIHLKRGWLKKKLFWKLFDKRLYNRAAGVVALTATEENQIRKMGVSVPVTVIPNGVQLDSGPDEDDSHLLREAWPQLQRCSYVLFLGRIEQIKGLDLLIPAFAQVRERFHDCVLVLAGPSERGWGGQMQRLAVRLGLRESVLFTGTVSGKIKSALLRNARALALTSYGEGLPMSVLEAMAAGIPVLVTEGCNVPEVVAANAGFVVEPTVAAIYEGLSRVLEDTAVSRKMGANARGLVSEKFTWNAVCRATLELCDSVITARSTCETTAYSHVSKVLSRSRQGRGDRTPETRQAKDIYGF